MNDNERKSGERSHADDTTRWSKITEKASGTNREQRRDGNGGVCKDGEEKGEEGKREREMAQVSGL